MKKSIYVLAVTLVIGTLVISSTASLPIMKNTPDIDNNSVNDYETSVTTKNGDNFIQRLMRLFSGEIIDVDISDSAAINSSKIDGVPSHDHDERYYTQAEVDSLLAGVSGTHIESGKYDGEVQFNMVQTDPGAQIVIDFENPYPTTEKPDMVIIIIMKNAGDGLVEGANIKAVEDIKGSSGNWTGFDITVSKYGGGNLSTGTKVYVHWIAIG